MPVVVVAPVLVVVPEVLAVPPCDWILAVEVRSISDPRPKTTPTNWLAVVFDPNTSVSETVREQSEFTL